MAPRSRDDESFEERRRQIARAAVEVFAEKGFRDATNRDIANAAGISPALIYWYFESKDELFAAIFEYMAPIHGLQFPIAEADVLPVEEFLTRLARTFLANAANPESQRLFRIMLSEAMRFPEPARQLGTLLARYPIRYIADYVERQTARGRIDRVDPWLTAQAFLGTLVGYVMRKYVLAHRDLANVDDEVMAATSARLFARGLLPTSSPDQSRVDETEGAHGDGH